MLALALMLTAQDAPPPANDVELQRLAECTQLATREPDKGEAFAVTWRGQGGGHRARQCLGIAYANQERWEAAATAFEDAAREAENKRDATSSDYWAQAGNAWLAAGNAGKAKAALDAALASGALIGPTLGEAYLDRARARVAGGDLEGARGDLDRALAALPESALAWLLSATLARRTGDNRRARTDIDQALRLYPEDASVQLEAGNVAVVTGDQLGARSAWTRVIELAPGSPQANAARAALGQLAPER